MAAGVYLHFSKDLPPIPDPLEDLNSVSRFYAADGRLLGELTLERREAVSLSQMPPQLLQAFLAVEDKRFFQHRGVDFRATLRAILANYRAGRKVQGASTLTQQLCKSRVGREKSYVRKIREAILARRTEAHLSKLEILALYLNQIYLGHGAYGVQAAAHNYFRKDISKLNLAESAMLAGLPPQPGRLNPILNLRRARARQRHVLDRMVAEGFVSAQEADAAHQVPLKLHPERADLFGDHSPHFTEHVRKQLLARYGYERLHRGGLKIYMTVDADRQRSAQEALGQGLESLSRRQGFIGPIRQLKPEEQAEFQGRLRAEYGELKALDPGQLYLGIVTQVKKRKAQVQVANLELRLPLKEGMRWAKLYDPEAKHNRGRLRDLSKVLAPGDLIRVEAGEVSGSIKLHQIPKVQGALISLDPHTGYVEAMVGGYDFDLSEYNRAFQGCRQPGSVFKPLVYALALEQDLTLSSPLEDTPIVVFDRKREFLWKPRNHGGRYKGDVLLRDALIHSMNIPAIRVIRHVGPKAAAHFARLLGISTPLFPDQSLVLGSSCVYPWEMVKVYASFALRGLEPRSVFIKRVETREGLILEDQSHFSDPFAPVASKIDAMLRQLFEPPERHLRSSTAFLLQHALRDVVRSGTGVRAKKLGKPAGGKTGTTDAYDAWFLGFTQSLVTGVWVGSDQNDRRLGSRETGGKLALPIWLRYMSAALEGISEEEFSREESAPSGVSFQRIDKGTGLLAPPGNPALRLPFRQGTEPQEWAPKRGRLLDGELDLMEGRF